MTGIRPPPRRGTRPCGLLLPASQAIGCDHRVGKGVRRVFAHAPREASAIGQYLATLGLSVFDWRRQFGPALDQTIFGLERHDPLVMNGAAAILGLVAIVAALVPARAAALVDPLLVLRHGRLESDVRAGAQRFASWHRMAVWLRQLDGFRAAQQTRPVCVSGHRYDW
jgi:hypothetical protein